MPRPIRCQHHFFNSNSSVAHENLPGFAVESGGETGLEGVSQFQAAGNKLGAWQKGRKPKLGSHSGVIGEGGGYTLETEWQAAQA
jgi:hypothetical protein